MKITLSIELRITVIISEIVPFPISWKKLHDITPKHTLRIVIIIKRRALLTSTESLISPDAKSTPICGAKTYESTMRSVVMIILNFKV